MAEQNDQFVIFRRNFESFVANYISNPKSQGVISKDTATRILGILRGSPNVSLPQLKYYVKQKNIHLRDFPELHLQGILCLPNDNNSSIRKTTNPRSTNDGIFGKYRRIAVKEELFDIVNEIHTQKGCGEHLGPRKTFREISRHHAFVPRDVVFGFVKMCPSCSSLYNEQDPLSFSGDLVTLSNLESEYVATDFKPGLEEMIRNPLGTPGSNKSPDLPTQSSFLACKKEPETAPSPSLSTPLLPLTAGNKTGSEEIMDADHFMAVGQVRIIDIQELLNLSSPPRRYTCLVHYIDLWSKYSVLWPLKMRDTDELASGIAKNVFAYFGSPKQIIYDTNFDEAQRLEESLKKWSKHVKVNIGLQEPLVSSGPVHWKIVDKLKELLAESWEEQLSKLQYISNTKLVTNHRHVTPYKAVLGKEPIAETFADLADKHNTFGDSSSSHTSTIPKSLSSTDHNVDSMNNMSYSLIPNATPVIPEICQINLNESDETALPSDQPDPLPTVNIVNGGNTASLVNAAPSPSSDNTVTRILDSSADNCLDAAPNEVPPYQMFHGFVPTTQDVCQIDLTEKEPAVPNALPTLSQSSINHLNPVPIACTVNRAAIAANKPQTILAVDQTTNHNFAPHSLLRQQSQPYTNEGFTNEVANLHTLPTSNYVNNNASLPTLSGMTNVNTDDFQFSLLNFGDPSPGNLYSYTNISSDDARLKLTSAERQARHRSKVKEYGDYDNYKRAHAEQQRKMRYRRKEREKLLPEAEQLRLLRERREKTKKRVAKWRALQKQKFERQFNQHTKSSTQNLPAFKMEPMT